MDIKNLETFLQIAHHQGFNRAAAHLNIAQSALSRRIKQLEDELGIELFERGGRGVHLTPAGAHLISRAGALLQQIEQTRTELMSLSETPRGEICIGLPPSLENIVGVPLLSRFRQSYPDVKISSRTGVSIQLREWVLQGDVDLAIYGTLEPEPILASTNFFREPAKLVGPPGWADGKQELRVRDLVGLPLILTPHPNSLRMLIENAATRAKIELDVIMQIESVQLTLAMVAQGHAFSVLPASIVNQAEAAGTISAVQLKYLSYNWIVAYSRERPISTAARRMIEMIGEATKTAPIDQIRMG